MGFEFLIEFGNSGLRGVTGSDVGTDGEGFIFSPDMFEALCVLPVVDIDGRGVCTGAVTSSGSLTAAVTSFGGTSGGFASAGSVPSRSRRCGVGVGTAGAGFDGGEPTILVMVAVGLTFGDKVERGCCTVAVLAVGGDGWIAWRGRDWITRYRFPFVSWAANLMCRLKAIVSRCRGEHVGIDLLLRC